VKGPGEYPINSSITIRQAIGEAGGFAEGGYRGTSIFIASLKNSFIVRDGRKLPIDFDALMNKNDPPLDVFVRPGDYIYIASNLYEEVYRLGEVTEQRAVTYRDGMTLVGCITGYSGVSGGYTEDANIRKVVLVRGSLESPDASIINLEDILEGRRNDIYLVPGDIVYVPRKGKQWAHELVKHAILTFVRSFTGNAGDFLADERWFPDDID
jgi:polysaccharide export outer membrane protein